VRHGSERADEVPGGELIGDLVAADDSISGREGRFLGAGTAMVVPSSSVSEIIRGRMRLGAWVSASWAWSSEAAAGASVPGVDVAAGRTGAAGATCEMGASLAAGWPRGRSAPAAGSSPRARGDAGGDGAEVTAAAEAPPMTCGADEGGAGTGAASPR